MRLSDTEKILEWLRLTKVKGVGPVRVIKLLDHFKDLERLLDATDLEILKSRLMNTNILEEWKRIRSLDSEGFLRVINECRDRGIKIITYLDEEYPPNLSKIKDPPLTLFCMGDITLLKKPMIAIVGARNATQKSLEWTGKITKETIGNEYVIVSGGAIGVDTAAHRATLECGGKTIAVLGSGVINTYPPQNESLFRSISESGGLLVSEHLPNFPGSVFALLQRNRIISGLANAVLVGSTSEKKGTFVQTELAYQQGKLIFCPNRNIEPEDFEGLTLLVEKYGAKEITIAVEMISFLKERDKTETQSKLVIM